MQAFASRPAPAARLSRSFISTHVVAGHNQLGILSRTLPRPPLARPGALVPTAPSRYLNTLK